MRGLERERVFPDRSLRVSVTVTDSRVTFPVFETIIVYAILSPTPVTPSPLSTITDVFITSMEGAVVTILSVGSLVISPSLSILSSEISVTAWLAGVVADTVAEFLTPPLLISS